MGKNIWIQVLVLRMIVIGLLLACLCYSIRELCFFESDYYFKYILNTFTGIILLTGVAYLCYPQKQASQTGEPALNKYKLVFGTESTMPQCFISDGEAWNTLRKQLKTTSLGYAVLYIYESNELPVINNTISAKKKSFDCWKPVCVGQISKDFGEL